MEEVRRAPENLTPTDLRQAEISHRWSVVRGISAILDLANQNARLKDPGFDIRKNLIGNLGNDFITYSKTPRTMTPHDREAPPGITLGVVGVGTGIVLCLQSPP